MVNINVEGKGPYFQSLSEMTEYLLILSEFDAYLFQPLKTWKISCGQWVPRIAVHPIIIEVLHNLFEAIIDLFRYPTTGRRAKGKFDHPLSLIVHQ